MIDKHQALAMVKRGMKVNVKNLDEGAVEYLVKSHGCKVVNDGEDVFVIHEIRDHILDLVKKFKPLLLDVVNNAGVVSGHYHAAHMLNELGGDFDGNSIGAHPVSQALSELAAEGEILKCEGNDDGRGAYCSKSYTGPIKSRLRLKLDDNTFGFANRHELSLPYVSDIVESIGGSKDVINAIHNSKVSNKDEAIDRYILLTMLMHVGGK